MNKLKRSILVGSLIALTCSATLSFADSSSDCATYLGWSDSDFLTNVSTNQTTSEDVTTALTNCLHENDCTSLSDNLSDCDILLSNRLYAASFYATRYALSSSSNSSSAPTSSSSAAPVASSSAPATSTESSAPATSTESSTSTSSGINW